MTAHYSRFGLDTYMGTPYFQAHIPEGYPINLVLQKCRAFRRLPPNLRKLSELAKQWAVKNKRKAGIEDIDQWYDDDGYELDPETGKRLMDEEIDEEWDRWPAPKVSVKDIPVPPGGFADPDTWVEPEREEESDDGDRLTEADILRDISLRGREYTARYYGVPIKHKDKELAKVILAKMSGSVAEGD